MKHHTIASFKTLGVAWLRDVEQRLKDLRVSREMSTMNFESRRCADNNDVPVIKPEIRRRLP
jgi:hypothetical protein